MSDTHDNIYALRRIVSLIRRVEPDLVVHCGDYISPFAVKELLRSNAKIRGVWGNNDGDKHKILEIISGTDFHIYPQPLELGISGYKCVVFHGWRSPELTKKTIYSIGKSGNYRFIFYGHTHNLDVSIVKNKDIKPLDISKGEASVGMDEFNTIIINPGEASGWLSNKSSVVLVDVAEKVHVRIIYLIHEERMGEIYNIWLSGTT